MNLSKASGIGCLVLAALLFASAINNTVLAPKIPINDASGLGVSRLVGAFLPGLICLTLGIWLIQKNKIHKPIEIPNLGTFTPQDRESGEFGCYQLQIEFRNSTPKLTIYPHKEQPPSIARRAELRDRFERFSAQIDQSLEAFPAALRRECRRMNINHDHLSDAQIINDLQWTNINLDPSGSIECFASLPALTNHFDISFGFNQQLQLYRLQFDG